jgi:hypothetical protein
VKQPPDPRSEFAEWVHSELLREFAHEREAWATDQVQRVQLRINEARVKRFPFSRPSRWIGVI